MWTSIVAIAGILQVLVLAVTAYLVRGYLRETERLRIATRDQVNKTQELVETAQRQLTASQQQVEASQALVTASQKQLEAQIRPAIVARMHRKAQAVVLENVGNGAAVNLSVARVDPGTPVNWLQTFNLPSLWNGSYLEPDMNGEEWNEGAFSTSFVTNVALQISYESLSGRAYATIVEFDGTGRPMRTRFCVKEE
ncbi:MAG TPA: hypothetical protein VEV41_19610 [Terriglobales bacterium]|nr:hypothetical protein [Terriglobales bacterium]